MTTDEQMAVPEDDGRAATSRVVSRCRLDVRTDLWRDEFNQAAETRVRSVEVPVRDRLVERDPIAQAVEVCDSAVDGRRAE